MSLLERISGESGVRLSVLTLVAHTCEHRYKLYTIPKVAGGHRDIFHPAREVKFLQRWIVSRIISRAPIHSAATAYRPGANVRNNALIHMDGRFFLKLDFQDFFPSIKISDIRSLLLRVSPNLPFSLTEEDINIVAKLLTRGGQIPIGAPSSPAISNAVMYEFDDAMSRTAEQFDCVYSRYADDITFSTRSPRVLNEVLAQVRVYLSAHVSPSLRINEKKVVFTSKKRRVRITGLVIDCDKRISVGRRQKRKIKALIHQFCLKHLDRKGHEYLKGYLAYVNGVEPRFLKALENKYGKQVTDSILLSVE